MNKFHIIAGFFFLVSIIFFIFGLKQYLHLRKLKRNGLKTIGTITNKIKKKSKFLSGSDEYSSIYYSYEITYDDYKGKKITKESDYGDQTDLSVGDSLDLIYDKNNTDSFIIFIEKQLRFYFFFILIAITFFTFAITLLILVMLGKIGVV